MERKRLITLLSVVVDSLIIYQMLSGSAVAVWLLLLRLVVLALQGFTLAGRPRPRWKLANSTALRFLRYPDVAY
jgi:hypothetical protein